MSFYQTSSLVNPVPSKNPVPPISFPNSLLLRQVKAHNIGSIPAKPVLDLIGGSGIQRRGAEGVKSRSNLLNLKSTSVWPELTITASSVSSRNWYYVHRFPKRDHPLNLKSKDIIFNCTFPWEQANSSPQIPVACHLIFHRGGSKPRTTTEDKSNHLFSKGTRESTKYPQPA